MAVPSGTCVGSPDAIAVGLRAAVLVVTLWFGTLPADAQVQPQDPWEAMRFRSGPLAWTPTIQIKNVGWDTNVFNTVEDPREDFTAAGGPQVEWWLRAGPARLHGKNSAEGIYFNTYKTEQAFNQNHSVTLEYHINRLRPYVGGSFLSAKERPGYEIDKRARRREYQSHGGIVLRIGGRTSLDLQGSYADTQFDGDEFFSGTYLFETLNRRTLSVTETLRHGLTPLTTLLLSGEIVQERFVYSPVRDADSVRAMAGLEFKPLALLNGTARAGYRKVTFVSGSVPEFSGLVASLNLGYTLLGVTRFSVGVSRDIQYSYEPATPYYVLNDFNGAITQRIGGPWDVVARGGRQELAYRGVTADSSPARTDVVETWGGGLGYNVGRTARLGLGADYYRRRSPRGNYDYNGLRAGLSVTYGL